MTMEDDLAGAEPGADRSGRMRRRWVPLIALLVLFAVIACLLLRFLDLRQAPDQPDIDPGAARIEMISVPDVVGLPRDQAVELLEKAGFTVETEPSFDVIATPGTIASQEPAAKTKATRGSTVFLGVVTELGSGSVLGLSIDDDSIDIPDVTGLSLAEATRRLERRGFTVSSTQANSASVPKGLVISQSPAAGTSSAQGEQVRLVVSLGRSAVVKVTVPDIMGLTQSQAATKIRAAGLAPRPMWQPNNASVGIIYEQSPEPGEKLPPGGLVFFLMGVAQ